MKAPRLAATGFLRACGAVVLLNSLSMLGGGLTARAQAPGTVDPVFGGASLGLAGHVSAVALQPDGKVLVGGTFGRGLLRLNADGSLDATFSQAGKTTTSVILLQPDGKILAAGSFEDANNNYVGLARFNADGSPDTSFQPPVAAFVTTMVLQPDGKILIGSYQPIQFNGTSTQYVVRLNANGSVDTGFNAGTTDSIMTMALQSDGKVVVGGHYFDSAQTSHAYLGRLNANGSLDTGFNAAAIGGFDLSAIAVQAGGKVLIGGAFTQVGAKALSGFARLNADGSLDTTFSATENYGVTTGSITVLPSGKILIGGDFSQVDGVAHAGIALLATDGSLDGTFAASISGGYSTVAVQPDGKFVIGGAFSQTDGLPVNSLCRLNASGSLDSSFSADVASGPNGPVYSLAVQTDGKLLITGAFTQVGTVAHSGLARLRADGSVDPGFNASVDYASQGDVVNIAALQPDGKILVTGPFGKIDGVYQYYLARLNADGSLDAGFAPKFDYELLCVAPQSDGKVLVGGYLSMVNGVSRVGLVRLNADGSVDTGFNLNLPATGVTTSLAVQPDGKILVAGYVANTSTTFFKRLNADSSVDTSFNPGASGALVAVQPGGKILLQGSVTVNGVGENGLLRLNADGSVDTGFQTYFNSGGRMSALVMQPDGKIVIGGNFTKVNGAARANLARLNADGSLDPFFNPGGSGPDQPIYGAALQSDGKIFVGGPFTSINGVLRNYVARLNAGGAPDFFNWAQSVGGGFYYEQFPNGNPFGYYNVLNYPIMYHVDLGFEYFIDAGDGAGGAYLYDFASNTFFYTSPTFPFPYLYDFSLKAFLYYYPDPTNPGHYNTNGVRYFYNFSTGKIISK